MRASRCQSGEPGRGSSGRDHLNAPAVILCYAPPKKSNSFNGPKTGKTLRSGGIIGPRAVIQAEVIAGREWEDVVSAGGVKSQQTIIRKSAIVRGRD